MQFYWQTTFGPITGDPEFCHVISVEISIKILVFTLDNFQEKLMTKKQKSKKTYWGHVAILVLFAQIWAKMNFPRKKTLSSFQYSSYLPLCQKSEKTMLFLRKMLNLKDEGTGRQKDRQKP